jgi:hypothetical protein
LRPGAARFIVARQDPVPFDLLIEVVLCEAVETSKKVPALTLSKVKTASCGQNLSMR